MDIIARIEKIQYTPAKGAVPVSVEEARLHPQFGIEGDYHGLQGDAVLPIWSAVLRKQAEEEGFEGLCFRRFQENISLSNLPTEKIKEKKYLYINQIQFQILDKRKDCHKGCGILQEEKHCALREVVFVVPIQEGVIKVGDEVCL